MDYFFLFSGYSKSTVGEKGGFSRWLWLFGKLIYPFFSIATIIELLAELQGNYDKQNQTYKNSLFLRNLNAIQQKDTHFWGNPLFFPHKILTSSALIFIIPAICSIERPDSYIRQTASAYPFCFPSVYPPSNAFSLIP